MFLICTVMSELCHLGIVIPSSGILKMLFSAGEESAGGESKRWFGRVREYYLGRQTEVLTTALH